MLLRQQVPFYSFNFQFSIAVRLSPFGRSRLGTVLSMPNLIAVSLRDCSLLGCKDNSFFSFNQTKQQKKRQPFQEFFNFQTIMERQVSYVQVSVARNRGQSGHGHLVKMKMELRFRLTIVYKYYIYILQCGFLPNQKSILTNDK